MKTTDDKRILAAIQPDPEPKPDEESAEVTEFPVGMRPLDVAEQMAADVRAAVQHFARYNVPVATAVGVLEIVKQELMQEA